MIKPSETWLLSSFPFLSLSYLPLQLVGANWLLFRDQHAAVRTDSSTKLRALPGPHEDQIAEPYIYVCV